MVRTEAPALGESRRQQLLPLSLSTAPAPDPTGIAGYHPFHTVGTADAETLQQPISRTPLGFGVSFPFAFSDRT